jgi:hypothetical protein
MNLPIVCNPGTIRLRHRLTKEGRVRVGLTVLLLCMPVAGLAAPRSVTDCAAITNAFAYNECLAMFGPKAGQQHYQPAPPPGKEPIVAGRPARGKAATAAPPKIGGLIQARRTANGRIVAEFTVGRPAEAPVILPKRRRHLPAQ